ncbi:hypothetical protein NCCP1664_16830 [Zafaria cholistanensis]|uniref:SsuA/THI5-like domain-containing protein n=1 Tax=Zafaria cholistanensis TaxID=1682741 RepID=A0A5A7NTG4_9MICC|nr:ABC transporter substrate-binding protein [Zafaria cholistanensis]GER23187.1 hypothetical protein NCCP1664_16830 [Zafaria cholistanensis]
MKRLPKLMFALGAVALAVTACSPATGSGDQAGGAASGGLREVNIGAVPVVDVAALYVGEKQGYFEEEGLKLNIEFGQGSAAMIPSLLNGQFDMLYGGSVNMVQAAGQGLPIQAVAVGGRSTGVEGEDHGGVLVLPESGIENAAGLEGKKVAVNALRGLHEVSLWASIRKAGGDPKKVTFLEMPLADMGAALESGRIDAASTSEPFLGVIEGDGAKNIASLYVDAAPNFVGATYFTSTKMTETDPEFVQAFVRALEKSFAYADANPEAVRAELGNFTKIDPALIDSMTLTSFKWGLTTEDIRVIADLAAAAESLENPDEATEAVTAFLNKQ